MERDWFGREDFAASGTTQDAETIVWLDYGGLRAQQYNEQEEEAEAEDEKKKSKESRLHALTHSTA